MDVVAIEGLLQPGEYFFIVNSDPAYRYPVVPSFRDWRFPHGQLPDTWPSPKASPSTDTCLEKRLSGSCEMACHGRSIAYVLHVFGSNIEEFSDMYHNTCVQYLDNTSRQYLFARLAWTILILLKPFVLAGTNRFVIRNNGQAAGMWVTEDLSGSKLSSLYGGGGSRSASPKKRSRQREDEVSLADSDDEWYEEIVESEEGRGRKRIRRECSPTLLDDEDRARTPALSNVSTLTSANKTPSPHSPSSRVQSSRKTQTWERTALADS
ncbi:hypothetical protein CFRS1_v009596 [Colletotrichum fructicola]|nr:hypothetical protein CFRS1_v009596 [Colletotrichum fructicola]